MAEPSEDKSMDKTPDLFPRRFIFHGNAVAASVYLTRVGGIEQYQAAPIDGQSSLPVIGGHSQSPIVGTPTLQGDLPKVFSYTGAHTEADGRVRDDGAAVTLVHAEVSSVQVTNQPSAGEPNEGIPIVFTASLLSLSMFSTHPPAQELPTIEFVSGTPIFQGLTLGGQPIELELNTELMGLAHWDDLEKNFRTNRKFFDDVCDSFRSPGPGRPNFGEPIPRARGTYAMCSFVRSIRWGGRRTPGHVLPLTGFGAVYFGEMLLNDRERRVTMVRMQLGSNSAGQAVFAENDPNGTWWPPHPLAT
jgi:hypothetical protein